MSAVDDVDTTELNKQLEVIKSGRAKTVEEFIDWLGANGYAILKRCPSTEPDHLGAGRYCGICSNSGFTGPVYDFEQIMADHFGIDRDKIEKERRALLKALESMDH